MLVRLVESGAPVQLRIGVDAEYDEDGVDSYNVSAEIPGSDAVIGKEVVLVGAHSIPDTATV